MATNRRDAILKGAALLGVTVGAGALRSGVGAAEPARAGATVLYGRHWHIQSRAIRKGEQPPAGIRMLVRGELVDQPQGGRKVGAFFATYYRLNTPGKVGGHEPGSLELHTFVFPDGTLVGSGVADAAHGSEAQFALLGGTGRFHGARGSYTARQNHLELGGDGTASFTLTLI
ncbi:MAG TPA: hypothetical protein VMV31_07555 [Terriglobales bacterium]|nr:hypothetical protein [Terriglobales bacterium]